MENQIVIATNPNFWTKFEFSLGISSTNSTSITENEYHQLALEAIDAWRQAFGKFGADVSLSSDLTKIRFEVSNTFRNDEDIRLFWRYSDKSNGEASFEPLLGKADKCNVIISKNRGPRVGNMKDASRFSEGEFKLLTKDQIRSAITHELGHVMGLGHCNYEKDLMFTFTDNQPDPNRKISNLDTEVISQKFSWMNPDFKNSIYTRFMIPESEWRAV